MILHRVALVTAGEERLPAGTAEKIRQFADFRAQRCETPEELLAAFSCDFEKNFFDASVEKLRQICGALQ